jgi:CRP/FNR family transcriptional regulator, anaerobic regulatory protein
MEGIFVSFASRKLNKGQILIYEGDAIRNIYLIVSGFVKVSSIHMNGTQRTIIVYAPGELFPLVSFLSGQGIARYFYECMSDAELKVMPQKVFQEKVKGDLELGEELIAYSYDMNVQFAERIEILSAQSARQKVAALLNYLASKTGEESNGKTRLSLPLTSQDIADMCGLTRETASVQLQRLKQEGLATGRRNLIIDNRQLAKLIASQRP